MRITLGEVASVGIGVKTAATAAHKLWGWGRGQVDKGNWRRGLGGQGSGSWGEGDMELDLVME